MSVSLGLLRADETTDEIPWLSESGVDFGAPFRPFSGFVGQERVRSAARRTGLFCTRTGQEPAAGIEHLFESVF